MIKKLQDIFSIPELKRRILFTVGISNAGINR